MNREIKLEQEIIWESPSLECTHYYKPSCITCNHRRNIEIIRTNYMLENFIKEANRNIKVVAATLKSPI